MTPKVDVRVLPQFQCDLKQLIKKYRSIRKDLDNFVKQLREGETPGDQVPHVGYTVYKVRVANSDAKRGKQGGYRIIYYVRTTNRILLITIYVKTEQSDISPERIRRIIEEEGDLSGE